MLAALLGLWGASALPLIAQVRVDPGMARPAYSLRVGLGGGFTSNPPLAPEGGEVSGDSIADLRSDFTARGRSPRTDWSAAYDSFYTRYGKNDQLDTVNHALDLDGKYLVSRRSRLSMFEHFFYSENPIRIGSLETPDESVILTRQARRWRAVSDAALDTQITRSLSLQMGVSARIERLDLDPPVDIDTYSGRVGFTKHVGISDSVSSTLRVSRFDFHDPAIAGADARGVEASWIHGVPARTDWTVSAGVSNVDRGGARHNQLTATASIHHAYRAVDLVSAYRRSLDADAGVATLTIAQSAYAGLSEKVGQRLSLGLVGEYGTRRSILDSGDQVALRYTGGSIHGALSLSERLGISGEFRRRKQVATEGVGEDLTVDTYVLALSLLVF